MPELQPHPPFSPADAGRLCPVCGRSLITFYRLRDQHIVVQCPNSECLLWRHRVEGLGDNSQEALDHFAGLSLKHQP